MGHEYVLISRKIFEIILYVKLLINFCTYAKDV